MTKSKRNGATDWHGSNTDGKETREEWTGRRKDTQVQSSAKRKEESRNTNIEIRNKYEIRNPKKPPANHTNERELGMVSRVAAAS